MPSDGWAWDVKGSAACTIQVPETRVSFSGDGIAQQKASEGGFTEGMDPGQFFIDQGYHVMRHQIEGTRFCTAKLVTDPIAKNHVGIQLTAPATAEPWDFYPALGFPVDVTASSTVHMFLVVRAGSGTCEVGWWNTGPRFYLSTTVTAWWVKGAAYVEALAGPIPGDSLGVHVYESELNPDGSTRVWVDGTLTTPTMKNVGTITHPLFLPDLRGPFINYISGTCYVYEWVTASDMSDADRQEMSQQLRDKYLP